MMQISQKQQQQSSKQKAAAVDKASSVAKRPSDMLLDLTDDCEHAQPF
jgi:hypothetical protein